MSLTSHESPDGVVNPDAVPGVIRIPDAVPSAISEPFVPNIPDIALGRASPSGTRLEAPPGTPRDGLEPNDLDDHQFLAGDDDRTGVAGLETIDLLGETVRLFRQTKRLLSKVLVSGSTPVNQQAQVAGTLGTLLKTLSQQQVDLYNAERLKRLESVMIRLVRDIAPSELQDRFMEEYEREVALILKPGA